MTTYAIKTFHSDLEQLKHFGGTSKETAIRFAFPDVSSPNETSNDELSGKGLVREVKAPPCQSHLSSWSSAFRIRITASIKMHMSCMN